MGRTGEGMMERWEIEKIIRDTVKQELATIMMATVTATASSQRATAQRYPGENAVPNQRIISPYGFASRPTDGTQCVTAPIAHDPTHLNIMGCHDIERPELEKGESAVYGSDGQLIHFKTGGTIHQGSKAADEPVVLGNVLVEFMTEILNEFIQRNPIAYDSFGLPVVWNPETLLKFQEWLIKYLQDDSTNIIGQKNFVERGD